MLDKPGPKPVPSAKAILSTEPRGAIARRNRVLKIYGIVLLAGILGLVGYCALRRGFDLSTPERALASFQRALENRQWSLAEKCLTPDCHRHYESAIADRTLFDFYNPWGYETPFGRFVADWRVHSLEKPGPDRAQAWISSGMPLLSREQTGFLMYLVRCPDGRWRIDGPRENFAAWYEQLIPKQAQGWAAAEERR